MLDKISIGQKVFCDYYYFGNIVVHTFDCLLSVGNFFEVIEQNSEIGKSAIGPNKAPFWKKVSLVFRTTYHYTYSR